MKKVDEKFGDFKKRPYLCKANKKIVKVFFV